MVLDIILYPDVRLSAVADLVTEFDSELETLVNDMFDTITSANAFGLTAPQVGVPKQIAAIRVPETKEDHVLINPMIVAYSDNLVKFEEGCLSLPGVFLDMVRYDSIVLKAYDLHGEEHEYEYRGFAAIVVQHQLDLLCGRTINDRSKLMNSNVPSLVIS